MENNNPLSENDSSSGSASKETWSTSALTATRNRSETLLNGILRTHQNLLISPTHLATLLRFSDRLAQLQTQLTAYATSVARYVHAHPVEVLFALFCMLCVATVPVILPAVGFSSAGPVAGSLAAIWQSALGAVAAGSPFAVLQSAAMGGVAGVVVSGVGWVGLAGLVAKKVREGVRKPWGWGKRRWEAEKEE